MLDRKYLIEPLNYVNYSQCSSVIYGMICDFYSLKFISTIKKYVVQIGWKDSIYCWHSLIRMHPRFDVAQGNIYMTFHSISFIVRHRIEIAINRQNVYSVRRIKKLNGIMIWWCGCLPKTLIHIIQTIFGEQKKNVYSIHKLIDF